MELSERKKKILAAIVEEYIETAEPVGSKAIAANAGMNFSSATIRNEMAELTNLGYLEQPHTSAGRVPSAMGYRLYVNELMQRKKLSEDETETINATLNSRIEQVDRLISDVGRLTSQLTNYPAVAFTAPVRVTISRFDLIQVEPTAFIIVAMLSNNAVKNKLVRLNFSVDEALLRKLSAVFNANFTGITEDRITPMAISTAERASGDTMGVTAVIASFVIEILSASGAGEAYVSGTSNLLRQPEFRDPDKAHQLMSYLSDGDNIRTLPALADAGDIRMIIGPENVAEELKDSSVIMARYDLGDNMQGLIGVVGPTRMDYSKVAAKLSYIASALSGLGRHEEMPRALMEHNHKGDIE